MCCHVSPKCEDRARRSGWWQRLDRQHFHMHAGQHATVVQADHTYVAVEAASTCMPCALGARHCSHARIVRHEVVDTRSEAVVKLIAVLGGDAHKLQEHQVDGAVV